MNEVNINQDIAIKSMYKDILVSASAGTGKTTLLVNKIVHMIVEHKIRLESILAITFTNNAATQLKIRIKEELEKLLVNSKLEDQNFIYQQILSISSSNISTFHSYCNKLIQKYFHFLNVSPNFSIISSESLQLLINDCLEKTIEMIVKKYNRTSKYAELLNYYYTNNSLTNLKHSLLIIYNSINSHTSYNEWKCNNSKRYINNIYLKSLWMEIMNFYKCRLVEYIKILKELIQQIDPITDKKYVDYLTYISDKIKCMIENENIIQIGNKIIDKPWPRKSKGEERKVFIYNQFIKFKKDFFKFVNNIVDEEQFRIQQQENSILVDQFIEVVDLFILNIEKEKKKKNVLDFTDLEKYSVELLKNPSIEKDITQDIKVILIDEYQDTSYIQEEILTYLKKYDCFSFMVGDIKQSIYSFRQAEVDIFNKKRKKYLNNPEKELIILDKNYRSTDCILNFINYCNKYLFHSSEFYNEDIDDFNLDREDNQNDCIVWNFYSYENKEDKQVSQVSCIVNTIKKLLLSGYIDLKGIKKKIELNDILILTRKRKSKVIERLHNLLKENGITYKSDFSGNFWDSQAIKDLLSLFRLLQNPYDDKSLLIYLKSVFCNLNDNEIYELLMYSRDKKFSKIWNAIDLYVSDSNHRPNNLFKKLIRFREDFEQFHTHIIKYNLSKFLSYILNESYYFIRIHKYYGDQDIKNNLDSLIEIAQTYDKHGSNALFLFNEFLDELREKNININTNYISDNASQYINIMTIHKAKGLEFPIVFLVDLENKFNFKSLNTDIQFSSKYGLAFKNVDKVNRIKKPSAYYDLLFYKNKSKLVKEEMRLLYVAMTRCKYKLYIFLAEKDNSNFINRDINSFTDVFYNIYNSKKWMNVNNTFESSDNEYFEKTDVKFNNNLTIKDLDVYKRKLNHQYAYSFLQNYKQKVTVSELSNINLFNKNINTDINYDNILKPKFLQETNTNNKNIGSIYHLILSLYDWKTKEELTYTIKKLIQNKVIDLETSQLLDIARLTETIRYIYKKYLDKNYKIYSKEISFSMLEEAKNVYTIEKKFTNEKVLIQGRIDLILIKGNKIIIIDFKTSKLSKDKLLSKYSRQLSLYQSSIKKVFTNYDIKCDIVLI